MGPPTEQTARPTTQQTSSKDSPGLIHQRCRWCGTTSFRRLLCPVCAASDLETVRSDGRGVVIESHVVHRHRGVAHNESLVRFDEGFVFRCRVVGSAPHMVWVGARVRPLPGSDPLSGELILKLCETDQRTDS
ncbi:Zn-ribbon domain-containing OB-fold protein [Streptomyces sp. NPDC056500]|uniref:Zn-ribbon domain-containing OB-fold protein n=1 Tax=Streptomyces sp. NPDC056500 TaxID=3345840 RepID=UPI0036C66D99